MFQKLFIFCLLNSIYLGSTTSSVPFITRCKADDSKCIKKSAQEAAPTFINGLPEFGVEKLDPFTFSETIDASTSGLNLLLSDITVTGLKNCIIKKMYRDVAKSKLGAKMLCTVNASGQYQMDGRLLIIEVKGNGKITVDLNKVLIAVEADMGEKTGKDGKKHWDVKRFSHTFELQDKSNINFENLFTGNDVLGRAASQVIESSSNDIVTEVGPPVIKAIIVRVVENIKRFFNRVNLEDLSLD